MKLNYKHVLYCLVFTIFESTGCKKFVDIDPPTTTINADNVYNSDGTAVAVLTGIYIKMSRAGLSQPGSPTSISFFAGLSADEIMVSPSSTNIQHTDYLNNNLGVGNGTGTEYWSTIYSLIYSCNDAIEGLSRSTQLSSNLKRQLLGEAKFLRAFFFFYLTNLYGDVPLVTSTDYTVNSVMPKATTDRIYQQIISDLNDSKELLSEAYVASDGISATDERVRPNKYTAVALLARVYLYTGDFVGARDQAGEIISQTEQYDLIGVSLEQAFLSNSREAIWQLQPVNAGWNSEEARIFLLPQSGPDEFFPAYMREGFYQSFDSDDRRREIWIGSVSRDDQKFHFPAKYKSAELNAPLTEYSIVIRLAEMFLIRAEAKIELNDIAGGIADLNIIRHRAFQPSSQSAALSPDLSKDEAINAVLKERRHELFTEWGHRWFDLIRQKRANQVFSLVKGPSWQLTDVLYPIPQSELDLNPNLRNKQNPGY